jgi:hypothetical protein
VLIDVTRECALDDEDSPEPADVAPSQRHELTAARAGESGAWRGPREHVTAGGRHGPRA